MLKKINSLSMPLTILIGCLILGSFYYMTEANKQSSIERQQRIKIQAEEEKTSLDKLGRAICANEAENSAAEQYKDTCSYDCKDGYYYVPTYENYYKSCLQGRGLEP